MSREELSIRIEKYLDGELSQEETNKLELLIAADDKVAKEVEFHIELRKGIHALNERNQLKSKISQWENDTPLAGSTKQSRGLWRPVLAAASISLVVTLSGVTLYHVAFRTKIDGNLKNEIANLSREVEKTSQETTEINDEIKKISEEENKQPNDAKVTDVAGTAFMLTSDGYLVTNYHIVKGKKKVTIEQNLEQPVAYSADVVATSAKLDFALLKINDKNFASYPKIPYSISDKNVTLAQKIYTLGYPKNDIVYTEGAISSLSGLKSDTMFYQLNIISAPGCSGSPIINDKGELIGILASKNAQAEGETYCVKMKYVLELIEQLKSKKQDINIKTNRNSKLSGKKLPEQVKSVIPFVFIVKA